MATMFRFLRWVVIVVWCTIFVLATAIFAMAATHGLVWSDFVVLAIVALAVRELLDWLT